MHSVKLLEKLFSFLLVIWLGKVLPAKNVIRNLENP